MSPLSTLSLRLPEQGATICFACDPRNSGFKIQFFMSFILTGKKAAGLFIYL